MKTLHLAIIVTALLGLVFLSTNHVYAPCIEGVQCGDVRPLPLDTRPFELFQEHFSSDRIPCKQGLYLAIKSDNQEPVCLETGTISKLASRGFFYGISANQTLANYTTILIPPGSEDQSSNKTYSPNVATAVLGVNNTVRWVNQADVGNSLAADKSFEQGGKQFGSSSLRQGESYEFTFTEPGTFAYHGQPHPWQRGTIIVLPHQLPAINENNTTKPVSEDVCGQFFTAPGNQNYSNTVPVLLMNSNSTACAKLTFTIISDYGNCNGQSCQHLLEFNSTLPIGNLHYEKHGSMISVSSGKDYTNSFNITAIPETIDLANYPVGANFTVTYIITPLPNATGFYDQSIPKLACERYPLVVGHTADQVNATDFSYIDPFNPPCGIGSYVLTGVEISGIDYKYVTLRLSTLG